MLLVALARRLPLELYYDFLEDMMRHMPAEFLREQEEKLCAELSDKSSASRKNGARRR